MRLLTVACLIVIAVTALAAQDEWQQSGPVTTLTITDDLTYDRVTSGSWRLGGVLEVKFVGRIAPHENSRFVLYAPGLDAIEGRFENVVLPEGWLYELEYDDAGKQVVLHSLRPNRAPAFPHAEGFGKYTIGACERRARPKGRGLWCFASRAQLRWKTSSRSKIRISPSPGRLRRATAFASRTTRCPSKPIM
jgi:hypothetical protein